jgi:parvulin-like peptidyl-prolyl isomerase
VDIGKFSSKKSSLLRKKYQDEQLQTKLSNLKQSIECSVSPRSCDIGWVCVDDLIPEFSDALKKLDLGEYTIPIFFDDTVHVLFASDGKPAKKCTLDEVNSDIENALTAKYQKESKEHYIKKLREKA